MPPSPCLDDETIAVLIEGRLDESGIREATLHMDSCASCRSLVAEVVQVQPAASSSVGRYVIVDFIGAGGMGIVYLAQDPDLGRKVALKLLRLAPGEAPSAAQARMLREAQATAQLSHPNVVTIYDVGTCDDEVFIAMELVDGETLSQWMQAPGRSWQDVLGVYRQAGEGLAAAHAAGLVHRDFKPDNVLVGRDGRVRVTDFGLARLSPPAERTAEEPPPAASPLATRMTQTGTLLGTPAYMSPEQLAGQPADARSDVFSYCVALHEALHGVRPFTGASVAELADAIERGDVRRSESAISAPEWLRRTVERGLKARPEERPPSMRALLDALAGPPVAEPAPSASRGRRAGTLLLALGLAAGAVAMIAHRSGPTGATASAPTAITGLPRPASSRPDAVDAYERALTKLRDGRWAGPDLTLATSLDPGLAAAHLRYALQYFLLDPVGAREHLARAVAERGRLDGHDQWLLRAAQAWMQDQPADPASFARVAAEAAERYPLDAELAFYAAMARSADHDDAGAIAGYDRALALDPSFGFAYAQKAELLAYRGDIEGARSVLDQCTRDAPSATMCTEKRTLLDSRDGRCDRVEHDAQRLVASDPSEDTPYWIAALAGYAQGRPTTVVRELLDEYERHATPAAQGRYALADRWRLAVLGGDFDSAIESAARYQTLVASSIDRRLHAYPALYRASALVESGRLAEAAQVAADFLGRQDAWVAEATSDDYAMLRDPTPRLLLIERRAGLITGAEFETRRAAWLATWERSTVPSSRPFLWLHAYATAVETSQDAERALAELPAFGSVPTFTPYFPGDAYVGTTYLRAGHVAEALPYLERAAHGCGALESPIEHTRAQLALGEALASNGRHDEACAAWNVVRSRWGMARPRSVTAEDARARAAAEGCPP